MPTAEALHAAVAALLPLPRSLTGPGLRQTLTALHPDMVMHRVASGTSVLDWVVPQEWTLRSARLTDPDGTLVADADVHPLHVLGYSVPVDVRLPLEALQPHLHSDAERPDAIPYRTSYYNPRWGFCLADRVRKALPPGEYHAVIDADLAPGHMDYGELLFAGAGSEELVVCSHVCHPGMANDNLSGNVVAAALAAHVASLPTRRFTWRFLWLPGTIGEIAWLAQHQEQLTHIAGGMVLAGLGDDGPLCWKRSRRGDGLLDRAAEAVLSSRGPHASVPYSPWGYAERQFNSLGFGIPVGRLSRTEHGTYPQYHTSADDLSFVTGTALAGALEVAVAIVDAVEGNRTYRNRKPHGEPRLGPRGLFPATGGLGADEAQLATLWILAESDGSTDLLAIAARSGLAPATLMRAALALAATDLLSATTSSDLGGPS